MVQLNTCYLTKPHYICGGAKLGDKIWHNPCVATLGGGEDDQNGSTQEGHRSWAKWKHTRRPQIEKIRNPDQGLSVDMFIGTSSKNHDILWQRPKFVHYIQSAVRIDKSLVLQNKGNLFIRNVSGTYLKANIEIDRRGRSTTIWHDKTLHQIWPDGDPNTQL